MADAAVQSPSITPGEHLVLFDGVCGLCQRLLRFVFEHDRAAKFRFASLQSDIGRSVVQRYGGNPDELTTMYVVAHFGTPRATAITKGRAALFVVAELGWPWRALAILRVLPDILLDWGYGIVSRTRYRIFGRYDVCPLPTPEFRHRFLE